MSQAEEIGNHFDNEHPIRAEEETKIAIGMIADNTERIAIALEKLLEKMDDFQGLMERARIF